MKLLFASVILSLVVSSWSALTFSSNSVAFLPSTSSLGIKEEFTVQFWFLVDNSVQAESPQILIDSRDNSGNGWYIQKDVAGTIWFMGLCSFTEHDPSDWNHIAVIANPTSVQTLLNGVVQCTTGPPSEDYSSVSPNIILGSSHIAEDVDSNFMGSIAEVRIFNAALQTDEIALEMNVKLCDPDAHSSLVAYYPLSKDVNEASGNQMPVTAINCEFTPDPPLVDPIEECTIVCNAPLVKDACYCRCVDQSGAGVLENAPNDGVPYVPLEDLAAVTVPTVTAPNNCAKGFPCLLTLAVPTSMVGTASVLVSVSAPDSSSVGATVIDNKDGTYTLWYKPTVLGVHSATTTVNSVGYGTKTTTVVDASPVLTNLADFQSTQTNLLPKFGSSWGAVGNGFSLDASVVRVAGQSTAKVSTSTSAWVGCSYKLTLSQTTARSVLIRGWAKASGVTGTSDRDFSIYVDVIYKDGSAGWAFNAPFSVGTHDWEQVSLTAGGEKPINYLTIYALMRNTHTGTAWFDGFYATQISSPVLNFDGVDVIPPGLLVAAASTLNIDNLPISTVLLESNLAASFDSLWNAYGTQSYALDTTTVRRPGFPTLVLTTTDPYQTAGASFSISTNQESVLGFFVSGWSKASEVTGVKDKGYSVYLDLVYNDGTAVYGQSVNFDTGSHDWQYASTRILTEKPVLGITLYALLRDGHVGTVWFDDVRLQQISSAPENPNLVPVLTDPGWEPYGVDGFAIDKGVTQVIGLGTMRLVAGAINTNAGAKYSATLAQSTPYNIAVWGWVKSEGMTGDIDDDFAIVCDIYYTDGSPSWNNVIQINPIDQDFSLYQGIFPVTKPVHSIDVFVLLRGAHTGTAWFDQIEVHEVIPLVDPNANTVNVATDSSTNTDSTATTDPDSTTETLDSDMPAMLEDDLVPSKASFWDRMAGYFSDNTNDAVLAHEEAVNRRRLLQASDVLILDTPSSPDESDTDPDVETPPYPKVDTYFVTEESTAEVTAFPNLAGASVTVTPAEVTVQSASKLQMRMNLATGLVDVGFGSGKIYTGNATGILLRDAFFRSSFVRAGGFLVQSNSATSVALSSKNVETGTAVTASYSALQNGIDIRLSVSDTTGSPRALSVYQSFPVSTDSESWMWFSDSRTTYSVSNANEMSFTVNASNAGSRGLVSSWPWAMVGSPSTGRGLGIALSPESPCVFRSAFNYGLRSLYVVCDVGMSPASNTQTANMHFVLFNFDAVCGARCGMQAYYDIIGSSLNRRVTTGGTWLPMTKLSTVTTLADFGFAFEEIPNDANLATEIVSADSNGVLSFRYVGEPYGMYLPLVTAIDTSNPTTVTNYLKSQYTSSTGATKTQLAAILSSAAYDKNQTIIYKVVSGPFCPSAKGCLAFTTNPSPALTDTTYTTTKFKYDYPPTSTGTVTTLDGEFLDSLGNATFTLNYRKAHFATATYSLTFGNSDRSPAIMHGLSVNEFTRSVSTSVRASGKFLFGNNALKGVPWGFDLFDVFGTEVSTWMNGGTFTPADQTTLDYWRAMSYQRPFGVMVDADYTTMTLANVESLFQLCLFYGFYPTFFSQNPRSQVYWQNPTQYNRDRILFRKYVPLIKLVDNKGWQPITLAKTNDSSIIVERWGSGGPASTTYFTVRNTATKIVYVNVTVDVASAGIYGWSVTSSVSSASLLATSTASADSTAEWVTLKLAALSTEMLTVVGGTPPPPAITSVTPSSGVMDGNFNIEILGTSLGFNGDITSVTVAGVSTNIVSQSSLKVIVRVGAAAAITSGDVVVVSTSKGTTRKANAFTFVSGASISSVYPYTVSAYGGDTITILGTKLGSGSDITQVTLNNLIAPITSQTSSSVIVTSPVSNTPGTGSVVVKSTSRGTTTLASRFTYEPIVPPAITGVTPGSGYTTGGFRVTITGNNLGSGSDITSVTFGGIATSIVAGQSSTMVIVIAGVSGVSGDVNIVVTSTTRGTTTLLSGFTYLPVIPPSITSVVPDAGYTTGNFLVTISGINLGSGSDVTQVTFGGVSASVQSGQTAGQVVVRIGSVSSPGPVDVSVTSTLKGTTRKASAFTYLKVPSVITKIAPIQGLIAGTNLVTITGTNLGSGTDITQVTLASVPATIQTGQTSTMVVVQAGPTPTPTSGDAVVVSISNGNTVFPAAYTYYSLTTAIYSVTPSSGIQSGGSIMTILGNLMSNGSDVSLVLIKGYPAAVLSQSAGQIIVRSPGVVTPGTGDVIVQSKSVGTTYLHNGYTFTPATGTFVYGSGASVCVVRYPCLATIISSTGAISGTVTVAVVFDGDGSAVGATLTNNGDGTYTTSFTPNQAGTYRTTFKVNNIVVSGMPLVTTVSALPSILPTGSGTPSATTNVVSALGNTYNAIGSGYVMDSGVVRRTGIATMKLANTAASQSRGASEVITLNQATNLPLSISVWVKAVAVSGSVDANFALTATGVYTDGVAFGGWRVSFSVGSYDWTQRSGTLSPSKPIKTLTISLVMKSTHSGTAYFDNLFVAVKPVALTFDGVPISPSTSVSTSPFSTLSAATNSVAVSSLETVVNSASGIRLRVNLATGAHDASITGTNLLYTSAASGFMFKDAKYGTDFSRAPNWIVTSSNATSATLIGHNPAHNIFSTITYASTSAGIDIRAVHNDTSGSPRALTAYLSIPVTAAGETWVYEKSIRSSVDAFSAVELTTSQEAPGQGLSEEMATYPWVFITQPLTGRGIGIGVAPDSPCVLRTGFNSATRTLFAACDIGMHSSQTNGGNAQIHYAVFNFDGSCGFRCGLLAYQKAFPAAYTRRTSPGGLLLPYVAVGTISNAGNFKFGYDMAAGGNALQTTTKNDEAMGIYTTRYVSEPFASWFPLNQNLDTTNVTAVMNYVRNQFTTGVNKAAASAVLTSVTYDASGVPEYTLRTVASAPWCTGTFGCLLFTLNPNPNLPAGGYSNTKASLDWSSTQTAAYGWTTPRLDGELIDSFDTNGDTLNYRGEHFSSAEVPLTFGALDSKPAILEAFSTYEFTRKIADYVHTQGRIMIGKEVFWNRPWGFDLFDVFVNEVNWITTASTFSPAPIEQLDEWRTLAANKVMGLLMSTDFTKMTNANVEQYFQLCLFYGFYPSFFSANSATSIYWSQPTLYNRDRALFVKYLPILSSLEMLEWQPRTYARTSNSNVLIERFGVGGPKATVYWTLYNTGSASVTCTVTVEITSFPVGSWTVKALVNGANYRSKTVSTAVIVVPAGQTEIMMATLGYNAFISDEDPGDGSGPDGSRDPIADIALVVGDAFRYLPLAICLAWMIFYLTWVGIHCYKAITVQKNTPPASRTRSRRSAFRLSWAYVAGKQLEISIISSIAMTIMWIMCMIYFLTPSSTLAMAVGVGIALGIVAFGAERASRFLALRLAQQAAQKSRAEAASMTPLTPTIPSPTSPRGAAAMELSTDLVDAAGTSPYPAYAALACGGLSIILAIVSICLGYYFTNQNSVGWIITFAIAVGTCAVCIGAAFIARTIRHFFVATSASASKDEHAAMTQLKPPRRMQSYPGHKSPTLAEVVADQVDTTSVPTIMTHTTTRTPVHSPPTTPRRRMSTRFEAEEATTAE